MALARPLVNRGDITASFVYPGDLLSGGESLSSITTVGAGTWIGAAIATGIITRTGPGGGYIDTTDTAANILTALRGNAQNSVVVPGTSFRLLFQNTVAFALTWAAGTGVIAGTGTLNVAASLTREYLVTVLNGELPVTLQANTTNASAVVTFVFPTNVVAYPIYPGNPPAVVITPGMQVSGTGITAGTTVLGLTLGQSGLTGITLSANATATSAAGGTSLTFGPSIKFDGLRSTTL